MNKHKYNLLSLNNVTCMYVFNLTVGVLFPGDDYSFLFQ